MTGRWFRFYDNVVDDPKAQRLSDFNFRGWVNLMCIASRNDGKISTDIADIAFALRLSESRVRDLLQVLQSAGLIERFETGYEPHNWATRQYKSDSSTQRSRESRERTRNDAATLHPPLREQPATVAATPPETEQIQIQTRGESSARERAPKGSRWPQDQSVPSDWLDFVLHRMAELGKKPPDLRLEAEKFANFWASKTGAGATKTDWKKTFLNWCLNARTDQRSASERRFSNLKAGASGAAFVDGERGQGVEAQPSNLVRLALSGGSGK